MKQIRRGANFPAKFLGVFACFFRKLEQIRMAVLYFSQNVREIDR